MSIFVSYTPIFVNDHDAIGGYWTKVAQSFNSGSTVFTITDIDISMVAGSPASFGTVYLKVYAVDGSGFPTGNALATGSLAVGSVNQEISGTSPTWTNFVMTGYEITANTVYAMVLSAGDSDTVYGQNIRWYGTSSAGYSAGKPMHYGNGSALPPPTPFTWSNVTYVGDLAFRVHGATGTGYVDATATITGSGTLSAMAATTFDPPVATGLNTMSTVRRLVAVAQNSFYYEDL